MVTICTIEFNTKKFYTLSIECFYVFCIIRRRRDDYLCTRDKITAYCNLGGVCLRRGTNWICKCIEVHLSLCSVKVYLKIVSYNSSNRSPKHYLLSWFLPHKSLIFKPSLVTNGVYFTKHMAKKTCYIHLALLHQLPGFIWNLYIK